MGNIQTGKMPEEATAMTEPQTALMAFVRARRGDKVLSALLATAADKFRSQAEAESAALRQEARQLRKASLHNLRSAKSRFEAADRRMEAIRSLELADEVRAAAVRAASSDLAGYRASLQKAANAVQAAVSRARELEAQAESTLRRIAAYPEVAAWEAITRPPGEHIESSSLPNRLRAAGADFPVRVTGGVVCLPVRSQRVSVPETTDGLHTG
jgi:hypothetical protein